MEKTISKKWKLLHFLMNFPFFDLLILLQLLFLLISIVGCSIRVAWLESIGVKSLMATSLLSTILATVLKVVKKYYIKNLLFLLLFLSSFLIFLFFSQSFIDFSSKASSFICFLMFPSLFMYADKINNVCFIKKCVFILNFLLFLFYSIMFVSPYSHLVVNEYGYQRGPDLTLGFDNPNQTAIMLLINFFILIIFSFSKATKKRLFKIISAICSFFVFVMIVLTKCRVAILIALLFPLIALTPISKKILKLKNINFLLLVPLIYILLVFLLSFNILGDSFDNNRSVLYSRIFEQLNLFSFFFGNYETYAYTNVHNGYLTIFAGFGIVVFLLYFLFIKNSIKQLLFQMDSDNMAESLSFIALLSIIVHSSVETAFLTSGSFYGGLALLVVLLILKDKGNYLLSSIDVYEINI